MVKYLRVLCVNSFSDIKSESNVFFFSFFRVLICYALSFLVVLQVSNVVNSKRTFASIYIKPKTTFKNGIISDKKGKKIKVKQERKDEEWMKKIEKKWLNMNVDEIEKKVFNEPNESNDVKQLTILMKLSSIKGNHHLSRQIFDYQLKQEKINHYSFSTRIDILIKEYGSRKPTNALKELEEIYRLLQSLLFV